MKRLLMAIGLATALAACQDRTSSNNNAQENATTHTDLEKARADEQKQVADAQNDADKAQADAQKKMAAAQEDANKAQADANTKASQARKDLTDKERDTLAQSGQPVTAVGTVKSVGDKSFDLTTKSGKDLTLKYSNKSAQAANVQHDEIKEGDQVRASYKVLNGDNVVQDLSIIRTDESKPVDQTK